MGYQLDFQDKTVCVTGAGRGIGKSAAIAFGSLGAHVIVVSRSENQLADTAHEIEKAGGKAAIITADLSKVASINETVVSLKKTFPRLDVLVNNHGANIKKPSETYSEEDWDVTLDTNLKSYFFLSTAVAREFMIPQGGGRIVNTASVGGLQAVVRSAAYCASKGGVIMITRVLASEWAKYNIRVNAVAPGYIQTELTANTLKDRDFCTKVFNRTPAGRFGKTEEVAGAIVFLASDIAGYVTGHVLAVDGGLTGYAV